MDREIFFCCRVSVFLMRATKCDFSAVGLLVICSLLGQEHLQSFWEEYCSHLTGKKIH